VFAVAVEDLCGYRDTWPPRQSALNITGEVMWLEEGSLRLRRALTQQREHQQQLERRLLAQESAADMQSADIAVAARLPQAEGGDSRAATALAAAQTRRLAQAPLCAPQER
jgi:hypothetical protein